MKTTPYERTLNYHVGPNEFEKVQATPEKQKPSIKNIVDYTKQLKPSLSDSWNTANLQKGKVTNEIDVRQPKSTIKSTKKHEKLVFGLDRQLHENIKDEKNVYKICQDLKNRMQSLEDDYENVFKKRKEFSESGIAAFAESQKTEIEEAKLENLAVSERTCQQAKERGEICEHIRDLECAVVELKEESKEHSKALVEMLDILLEDAYERLKEKQIIAQYSILENILQALDIKMKNSLVKSNKLSQLNRLDQKKKDFDYIEPIILHINDPGRKGKLSKKLMKHLTLPEQNLALSAYRKYEPMQKPSIQVQHPSVYQDMALLEVESYNWTAEEKKAAALIIKGKYKRDEKLLFTTAQGDDTTGVLKEENKIQVLKSGITRLSDN